MPYTTDVYVVGCGGIGGYLLDLLPQVMACLNLDACNSESYVQEALNTEGLTNGCTNWFKSLNLIDGDSFSGHNALRQEATSGSKLVVQMNKVRNKDAFTTWLNTTELHGYEQYVTPKNIASIFDNKEGSRLVVFLCVDNHKTRYEISKWLEENNKHKELIIINGGNKKVSGNVTVYCQDTYRKLDPPIYKVYPEINDTHDLRPDEVDCGTVTLNNDQTAITNSMIASIMLSLFSKLFLKGIYEGISVATKKKDKWGDPVKVRKNEVLIDFNTMTMQSLSHSADLDNTKLLSILEGEAPQDAELN